MSKPLLVPYSKSKLSIVIPTYQRPNDLKELLDSITYWNGCKNVEVIVVANDNGNYSFTQRYRLPIKLLVNHNTGTLSLSRNMGAKEAQGDYIFFIDDDNTLTRNTIRLMVEFMDNNKEIGICSPITFYSSAIKVVVDGGAKRYYFSSFTKNLFMNKTEYPSLPYLVDEVSNAFVVRKEVFNDIGYFDEVNFPMDLDEADLCIRAKKKGWKIAVNTHAKCYHKLGRVGIDSLTFRRDINAYNMGRNRVVFQRKHFNLCHYWAWSVTFLPVFWLLYIVSQLKPGRIKYIKPFTRGVIDGICQSCK